MLQEQVCSGTEEFEGVKGVNVLSILFMQQYN